MLRSMQQDVTVTVDREVKSVRSCHMTIVPRRRRDCARRGAGSCGFLSRSRPATGTEMAHAEQ